MIFMMINIHIKYGLYTIRRRLHSVKLYNLPTQTQTYTIIDSYAQHYKVRCNYTLITFAIFVFSWVILKYPLFFT